MECELCGRRIVGKPYKIRLEGVLLTVCEQCARRHQDCIVREAPRPAAPRRGTPARRRPAPPLLDFDIVEDYHIRIREAREALGLTRELLAREVGEKESVIRRIEEGRLVPPIDLARKLERVLRIKLVVPRGGEEEYEEYKMDYQPRRFELTLGDIVVIRERRKRKGVHEEEA